MTQEEITQLARDVIAGKGYPSGLQQSVIDALVSFGQAVADNYKSKDDRKMSKYIVRKSTDAYIVTETVVTAETAVAAETFAERNEDRLKWKQRSIVEHNSRRYHAFSVIQEEE